MVTPECRVRVEQELGRPLSKPEQAEIDARVARSRSYLMRHEDGFRDLPKTEQLQRAGAHAAELRQAEIDDVVRALDLDFRLKEAGRDVLPEQFDALVQSGRLNFRDRASDLPQFRDGAHDDAVAVTLDDGRVVIFRDHMSPEAMPEILLHELGVHAGMRGYLGDDGFRQLLLDVEAALRAGDDSALLAAQRVPADTDSSVFLEEVLAHWVQFATPKDGFWSKTFSQMKAWIYKTMPALRGRLALDDEMLLELARGAMKREGRIAKKLVSDARGRLRVAPLTEEGGGRFGRGPMSRDRFEAEMRAIRADWDPADIDRAYRLHLEHARLKTQGSAPPVRDEGLALSARAGIEARGGPGEGLLEESDMLETSLRERLETDGIDVEAALVIDPETGREVPLRALLDDLDSDRTMLERLRGCAYPGGRA